jgi:Flp pilus assembly CpaE family ATPase
MSEQPYQTNKVTVMLAGAGHEVVYYQMQPPLLADQRFMIAGHAAQWSMFETNLNNLRPDLVLVQSDIAPDPDSLIRALQKISAWHGIAIVVLPLAHKDFQGAFSKVDTVRGVFVAPINWTEIVQAAYGAAVTAQTKLNQTAPMQQSVSGYSTERASAYITGTKRIAVLSHAGGSGCSTIAENLAYELSVRLSVKTLLISMGLPPAAAPHLRLRYLPNLSEYFDRPGKATFQAAIQRRENLEVLLAPESSLDYMRILEHSNQGTGEGSIYGMLTDSEDGRYASIVMDVPASEDLWMAHASIFANTALIVARPTLADLAAVRHTLTLLLSGLKSEKRLARESIYLVLNQFSDRCSFTPRSFQEELSKTLGWAPPLAAIIPYDPGVPQAQDDGIPPVTRGDEFAKSIRAIVNTLFPSVGQSMDPPKAHKSILRLPKIRFT